MIAERLMIAMTWIDMRDGQPVRAMARVTMFADDHAVWPVWGDSAGWLEVYVDDLLSQLAEFWQSLMLRQTYPLPIVVERPSQLRPEAEKMWGALPEGEVERQEDLVAAFEDAHNLARSFGGQFDLPSLWLFRQGSHLVVEASDRLIRAEFCQVTEMLSRIGDSIAERLDQLGGNKWARLVHRWRQRDQGDPDTLLAWSTGLSRESACALREAGILQSASSVRVLANDDDELRIAARMAGALPVQEIERVLRCAARIPLRLTPELDELSRDARAVLTPEVQERLPFEQGVAVARRIREHLGLGPFRRADPFPLLYRYKVHVEFEHLSLATLDALAIWGRRHGPGVILNLDSRRLALTPRREAAGHGAARVTAAHELCHLLLDREQALGAVDILNGRMPLVVEQRARAFAAAFMLPSEASQRMWNESGAPRTQDGVVSVLRRLTRRFGVTTSVAAWQLEHGLCGQDSDIVFLLDQISPHRRITG